VNELNADCLALPPDHFAKFSSTRVGNQPDLEPAWQIVSYFDNKFCAGSRQIAQAAFVVRQTMGCDPCRLAAPPPHFAFCDLEIRNISLILADFISANCRSEVYFALFASDAASTVLRISVSAITDANSAIV
jgi:hypothetical protein